MLSNTYPIWRCLMVQNSIQSRKISANHVKTGPLEFHVVPACIVLISYCLTKGQY